MGRHEETLSNIIHIHDVLIIGAGPSGLAVAARLSESMPAANFTDDEHRRFHWIKRHQACLKVRTNGCADRHKPQVVSAARTELDILALDEYSDTWMARWKGFFKTFDIPHLRSPMFFHIDPAERDGLLSYAYATGRKQELRELTNCVGKELSKHERKKRERSRRQPRAEPTVDERDRQDYFVPSTPLFFDQCTHIADRYKLLDNSMVSHEKVEDIQYDYVKEYSNEQKIFMIKTNKTVHYSRTAVLAIGGNPAKIPHTLTPEETEGATHVMYLKNGDLPSLHTRHKMASSETHIVVVGGGLTSAQIADVLIRKGVTHVYLIMRGPLKIKHFDIGLEWVGKFRNVEHANFWNSSSHEERYEKWMAARNGGSITPYYKKIIEKHAASGRLSILQHTTLGDMTWNAESKTWAASSVSSAQIDAPVELPPIDHIYFATGVGTDFESLPFLQSMRRDYPVENCGGFPCITESMAWRDDVPLFVAGRFAGLQLGPGAPNLIGARIGADRIAWAIQDVLGNAEGEKQTVSWSQDKFDYVSGRGSRFTALADFVAV
ncbi:FAD binding domain-containing protein [Xylariaceae sp. FL0255]|nr:FAD binding domain-containing protein [Xylariaceae sp. FL0255]